MHRVNHGRLGVQPGPHGGAATDDMVAGGWVCGCWLRPWGPGPGASSTAACRAGLLLPPWTGSDRQLCPSVSGQGMLSLSTCAVGAGVPLREPHTGCNHESAIPAVTCLPAEAFEGLLGAVFLDCGGQMEVVSREPSMLGLLCLPRLPGMPAEAGS